MHQGLLRLSGLPVGATYYLSSMGVLLLSLGFATYELDRAPFGGARIQYSHQKLNHADQRDNEDSSRQYRIKEIGDWGVFGHATEAVIEIDYEALPETDLKLALHGTFTSTSVSSSSALVSVENHELKRVYIGEEISSGVTLHMIHGREVIIQRGSILETLNLHDQVIHTNPGRRNTRQNPPVENESHAYTTSPRNFQESLSSQKRKLEELRAKMNTASKA